MTAANDPATPPPEDRPADATSPGSNAEPSPSDAPPAPDAGSHPQSPARTRPRGKRLTPEELATETRRLDRILVGLVLVLAFFLSSFLASNTDYWMHLACGGYIARGQYDFRGDPFAYTTAGIRWVNHSWLYDLALFGLSGARPGGEPVLHGTHLIVFKALLVTVLAGVMLMIRRPGQSLWLPAVCVGLAVIAMSPGLLLQPVILSLLFLGLTLYLLQRPHNRFTEEGRRASRLVPREWWLLPLVFACWVNLDSWFLLGPLTVALYLAGETLQQALAPIRTGPEAPRPGERRTLALVLVASSAACLLSPYHIHGFTLPADVWAALVSPFGSDRPFAWLSASPFGHDYLAQARFGLNPAGLCYFVLLGLGFVSFALNAAGWRWWRAVLWLAFFSLSAWLAPAIPLFAVVTGPIAALNFQDFVARRFGTAPRQDHLGRRWSIAGRFLTVLLGLALLVLAWPGWLNAPSDDARQSRRVAWGVEVEPSLRQAALTLKAWRQEGFLRPDDHGFNFSPDIAHYCAWFCPDERGFFDDRSLLFPGIARTFVEVRQALDPRRQDGTPGSSDSPDGGTPPDGALVKQVFQEHGISHVIVTGSDWPSTRTLVRRLWREPPVWTLLYADGRASIFGWQDPADRRQTQRWRSHRFDPQPLAFGPAPPEQARPPEQVAELPRPRSFWDRYSSGPNVRPLGCDTAEMYADYFEDMQRREEMQRLAPRFYADVRLVLAMAEPAAAAGTGAGITLAPNTITTLLTGGRSPQSLFEDFFLQARQTAPSGALLLAIRSARRAIVADPEDPPGYKALARAYQYLWLFEEARWIQEAGGQTSPSRLQELRQVQTITALQNALTLNPEDAWAHQALAETYGRLSVGELPGLRPGTLTHLDLAVEQWHEYFKYARAHQPPDAGIDETERGFKRWEEQTNLQQRRDKFELAAKGRPILQQALLALQLGLAKTALELLLDEANLAALSPGEKDAALYVTLALDLSTGRVGAARSVADTLQVEMVNNRLAPELLEKVVWEQVLLAAATGDYSHAKQLLSDMLRGREARGIHTLLLGLGGQVLEPLARPELAPKPLNPPNLEYLNRFALTTARAMADIHALRGVLALEAADTRAAARDFAQALTLGFPRTEVAALLSLLAARSPEQQVALWAGPAFGLGPSWSFATRPVAVHYQGLLRAAGTVP